MTALQCQTCQDKYGEFSEELNFPAILGAISLLLKTFVLHFKKSVNFRQAAYDSPVELS